MLNRKETAWKKSRKFGDVKGGRMRPKLADQVFNRQHSLLAPTESDEIPFYIVDNPSRDYFFPITVDDIKQFLARLPKEHSENLTHIWLRKMSTKEFEKEGALQGSFICGSGVNLIVLYPFPRNLTLKFGKRKPSNKTINWYKPYGPILKQENGLWCLKWTEEKIKQYYLEGLLLHEIGHQIDSVYQRYWSSAYKSKAEKFADNFAFYWGNELRTEIK